ncbi:tetratricopeptide repeat protein 23 [Exaiptasia diaphana]|uniref:Uncharacterized protein n=1 Tax=Exaiptasia diaphana TaxID=2652724 RepID=A0A913X597_EXADI|nr:tetratricopeptide repeat protein 23 [Exaiptasia diaphana]KXJ15101.1 Tetratricopeptide repeat protein 23 [Exaiptasia diaphana]
MADDQDEASSVPPVIISIPSASSSVQESIEDSRKVHHGSSSEDSSSDAEDTSDKPEVLLKRTRKIARHSTNEESVRERIRCVALARIVHGDCHWQLAKAYSKLAQAYLNAGMELQALGHAGNARDILVASDAISYQGRQNYDRRDVIPVIERTYLIMGQAYLMLKQYKKAENTLKKAQLVSSERSSLSKEYRHPERAVKIDVSLGKAALKLGKAGFALESFEKALELAQEKFGNKSKRLIPIYQNIGQAEMLQGMDVTSKERALDSYLKAHAIAKERYEDDSIEVLADSSMAVAGVYCLFDDDYQQSKAQQHLQAAYDIYNTIEGPYSARTIKAQEELCHLLIRNNSIEESIKLLKSLLSSKLAAFGDPSVEAANVHHLLGSIYLKKGKIDSALQHLKSCKAMLTCALGPNHRKTKKIQATMDFIKRAPTAKSFASSEEKLKERPRFSQVVGRSKPLGSKGIIAD